MFRSAFAAALAAGLAALPACKKKSEPTQPPAPQQQQQQPIPTPQPNVGIGAADSRFPAPPVGPLFRGQNPLVAAAKKTTSANFVQIGLALHGYHDANGFLPGGFADRTGKPGLSWRVAILQYLEQAPLFKQFKLDEPWDSPHNIKLVGQMPKQFAAHGQTPNGWTFTRGFAGGGAWLPAPNQPQPPGQPIRAANFSSFTDGLSNTVLVAEAGDPVIWTKPDEVLFQPPNAPKLGGVFDDGTTVLLGDGSQRFVRRSVSAQTVVDAIGIADGRIVNWDQ